MLRISNPMFKCFVLYWYSNIIKKLSLKNFKNEDFILH